MSTRITDREDGSRRVQQVCEGVSRTEKSHRDACNINTIIQRARRGVPFKINPGTPLYGDFTGIVDFHTAKTRVIEAERQFQQVPSRIRKRFNNDPAQLISFLQDPENRQEAIELGLVNKPPKEEIVPPAAPQEPEAAPETE